MTDFPPPGGASPPPPPGTPGPAPGWWQASDGNWYPPDQQPGYGGGYGTPAGYGYGVMQPIPKTNGMAIASLVCSCLTLACGVTFILGIIFGHIALAQIKRDGDSGRGMALAGLIIGYVCLVGALLLILVIVVAADDLDTNGEFQFEGLLLR